MKAFSAWALFTHVFLRKTLNTNADDLDKILSSFMSNATIFVIETLPFSNIPAKTWISFDDSLFVEIDHDLSPMALEKSYNRTQTYHFNDSSLIESSYSNDNVDCDEYYFMDIMGYSLEERIKAKVYFCDHDSSGCKYELQNATLHVESTASPLGGTFTIEYPSDPSICKGCQYVTDPISVYSSASEIETKIESLSLVGDVTVSITESERFEEYKVPVASGIVGANRNFYIQFKQNDTSNVLDNLPLPSTSYLGDVPMLILNQNNIIGEPTRDSGSSDDYKVKVSEITKGTHLNHGGLVEVAVSLNGGVDFTLQNLLFSYEAVPIVRTIIPTHGSISGNTKVRIIGDNFSKDAVKSCLFWGNAASFSDGVKFGMIEVVPIAQYLSPVEVICTTPASEISQDVYILLFANEEISSFAETLQYRGQSFHFHEQIEIISFNPESSTATGNITVNIFGGPFYYSEDLFCLFGTRNISAHHISPTQISCKTPSHSSGSYSLEVTQNGQDYTQSGSVFRFYDDSIVHGIDPTYGPAVQAGTKVIVRGENFVNSTLLRCRFGSVVVPATFIRNYEIHCFSPSVKTSSLSWISLPDQRERTSLNQLFPSSHGYPLYFGRLVSLEITNNDQDYTDSGLMFLYYKDVEIDRVSRTYGPSRGGTPLFISGSNFVNTTLLTCRFGNDSTKAYFLNEEAVLCFSSAIYGKSYSDSAKVKIKPILISNNAVDFSYVGEFMYSSFIPGGKYQAGVEGSETLLSCPRGSYCSDYFEANFTLCSPGTYQPLPSQSQCILCPQGYVCPEFGLFVPRICPAGFVCDEKGMHIVKLCPAGYWCDRGTATLSTECLKSYVTSAVTITDEKHISNADICFENSTNDFGLQASNHPASIWSERHLMPLDTDASAHSIRGKFCLDDSCLKNEDSNNFGVFDRSFDYSSTGFLLRRPQVCPSGHYCNPGTTSNFTSSYSYLTSPYVCFNAFYCPEGSSNPKGIGHCTKGFYCRYGVRKACPVGTFCPNSNIFNPLQCEPGTFNFMIGQTECSICPIGYMCPRHGLIDPVICPPGFVCSRKGLASPNIRCPAGFYCQNGTKTSDPFRNDTTLRPLACTPGTYCLAGTGYNEVREVIPKPVEGGGFRALYAQPCARGFFCGAASTSAMGFGPCPPGFTCPEGTANPKPTPKGFFAEHPGTVSATACLPGFYAPTVENQACYECPPGTTCAVEGLFRAEECPPGTYRSGLEGDSYRCVNCPQGTWSKNWLLREKGECQSCPTGVVCPLEGMTTPCSFSDLPKPFEPIVNFKGIPAFEYEFSLDLMPPRYSLNECLALNSVSLSSTQFFYGELIPPYIDVLGRGAHFRPSDQQSLKYQSEAKCYKNSQPNGSLLYRRMVDYYGPQFEIQTGFPHQGYGTTALLNQMIATAPPPGYNFSFRYDYFLGRGSGYIDLPKARVYEPSFNCTKGLMLMNTSLIINDLKHVVYTDPVHDFEGGYDAEKCSTWDSSLRCFIDEEYRIHARGECCNVKKYEQRAIFLAYDQFYEGTCEADRICSDGKLAASEAKPCDDGFICDERSSLENSINHPCNAGFVCDYATTPDTKLYAPNNQLRYLCPEGFYCNSGTGISDKLRLCPFNYFCPTGTADPYVGMLANDALLRLLPIPESDQVLNIQYQDGDAFVMLSDHDLGCKAATHASLQRRFQRKTLENTNSNFLEYLSKVNSFSFFTSEATELREKCARDNKSMFINDLIKRKECDCRSKFFILAAIYRLWRCSSDDFSSNFTKRVPLFIHGNRSFLPPNKIIQKNDTSHLNPPLNMFDLKWGRGRICKFKDASDEIGLTTGRISLQAVLLDKTYGNLSQSNGYLEFDGDAVRFPVRFTSTEQRVFNSYSELKRNVTNEFLKEYAELIDAERNNIDPFIFDLYKSIQLIEEYGVLLENLIHAQPIEAFLPPESPFNIKNISGPVNWCECQTLLKCPNGTITSAEGASHIYNCTSTKDDVLSRITLLQHQPNANAEQILTDEGRVDESASLKLNPFEVAILTIDHSRLPTNMSYGEHYQISIYDGCKPCPLRYRCNKAAEQPSVSTCKYPSMEKQVNHLNQCLKENRKMVCIMEDGSYEDVERCLSIDNTTFLGESNFLLFSEPDLEFCLSRPYFCSDSKWNFRTYRRLCQDTYENGIKSPIYDCVDVHRWEVYIQWRNTICCSSQVPELRDMDSCTNGSVCVEDPVIEEIIKKKLLPLFEHEHGFIPPTERPKGQLLMNSSMQEERDHESPLDLFNEWQEDSSESSFSAKITPHNKYKPELSQPWIMTSGCCKCQRHITHDIMDKNARLQLAISALAEVELTIVVELLHGLYYSDFIDYFGSEDKSRLRIHTPNQGFNHSTFLAILEKTTFEKLNLDLPLNLPLHSNADENIKVELRFFVDNPSNFTIGDQEFTNILTNRSDNTQNEQGDGVFRQRSLHASIDPVDTVSWMSDSWTHGFMALPYIPFLSNCDGYDSHISWSRLLEEHPDCQSMEIDEGKATTEHSFFSNRSISDVCLGVILECTYDEEISEARENLRWYEASSGSPLFYITRDLISINAFVPSNHLEEWGKTSLLNKLRNSYDVIPLLVDEEMGGFRDTIPRLVLLELKYNRISMGKKKLVEARLYFDEVCTTQPPKQLGGRSIKLDKMKEMGIHTCEVDINGDIMSKRYKLEIRYFPLDWFELLNRFEFSGTLYFLFYSVIGFAVCAIGSFVFFTNRLLTKIRHPPFFDLSFIKLVSRPQIEGCTMALIPYMSSILIIRTCFGRSDYSIFGFDNVHMHWEQEGIISTTVKINNSVGRLGLSLLILGWWIVCRGLQKLIPNIPVNDVDSISRRAYSHNSIAAKRAHFLWTSFCVQALMLCVWEFSYSEVFKNYIYRFVILFRVVSFASDFVLSIIIKQKLLIAPMLVFIHMTELITTVGARDFVDFVLSYLVKVSLVISQRLFIYPLIKTVATMWPRWKMMAKHTFKGHVLTHEQKKESELMWKKVNEEIFLKTEGMEPMLDAISIYSIEKTAGILVPFVCVLLMVFYRETEIATNYNINQHELFYYCIFGLYMIPWMSLVDAFIFNSQELLYGWKVYDYFSYQRWRFANREQRWNLYSHVDLSITESYQTIDLMCFSSQYYFILSMLTLGFGTNIFGLTICLRRRYNFLADPVFIVIVAVVIIICETLHFICRYISNATAHAISWDGIWKVAQFHGTMDDMTAAKLVVAEGKQVDIEQERRDFLVMNSETFRHNFIEKNRPWILQHLIELLTPRTLQRQQISINGHPGVDFVRGVYSDLINVSKDNKLEGDFDVSSDSSDDEFEQRRKWERTPLEGSQLSIAQIWFQKARKRRLFTKVIMGMVEQQKEDYCSVCSRTLTSCKSLSAGFSWNGEYDDNAMDNLIKCFEDKYSSKESDINLWKSFFRENVKFITRCNICLHQIELTKLQKSIGHVGAGYLTRPEDVSSDDESEDDVLFDPVIIARSSNEGSMMSKWLQASRARLGGDFPRNDAKKQSENYIKRLKNQKLIARPKAIIIDDNSADVPKWGNMTLNQTATLMIKKWLLDAKKTSKESFDKRATEIRKELQALLTQVTIENDWHFGVELRLEGISLNIEGNQILQEKNALESDVARQIELMRLELDNVVHGIQQKQKLKINELENSLDQLQRKFKDRKELREVELSRSFDKREGEQECVAAELDQLHQELTATGNDLKTEASSHNKVLDRDIHVSRQKFQIESTVILERMQKKYLCNERNWQKKVMLWLGKATRKIQAKEYLMQKS